MHPPSLRFSSNTALEGGIDGLDFGGLLGIQFAPPEGCYPVQVLPHLLAAGIALAQLRFWDVPPWHRSFFEVF
jgi:hypothetical protein